MLTTSAGHSVGDHVLKVAATRMASVMRPIDTLARFGGDKFTVLIEDTTDTQEAVHLANSILSALTQPIPHASREVKLTVSIGIVHGKPGYVHPDSILGDADIAMYIAKALGKNRHATFLQAKATSALQT